jgi:hypothetical protein
MKADAIFGASGMINLSAALRPHRGRQGECRFPVATEWRNVGLTCNHSNPRWFFVQLIRAATACPNPDRNAVRGAIESCQLDEGVAVFMELKWEGSLITRCSIQVIVAPDRDLETLYWRRRCKGVYYRLDYSMEERGKLFDHPFPHVHSVPDGAPRFHFPVRSRVFLPFALLEFVMMNRHYEKWWDWIQKEYQQLNPGEVPDDELTPQEMAEAYKEDSTWRRIDATQRNQFLTLLREASRRALEGESEGYPMIDPELSALNYW